MCKTKYRSFTNESSSFAAHVSAQSLYYVLVVYVQSTWQRRNNNKSYVRFARCNVAREVTVIVFWLLDRFTLLKDTRFLQCRLTNQVITYNSSLHWPTPHAVAFSLRLIFLTVAVVSYIINHLLSNAPDS